MTHRNITAARASWRHARDVADRLPDGDSDRTAMRIAPRTLLCASAWLAGGSVADIGFDELRDLASDAGDKVSLTMGMAGWVSALVTHARVDEASRLATELTGLLESIGDPTLVLGLLYSPVAAKYMHAEMTETERLAQLMIDLADGDATKGNLIIGSPLTGAILLRGCARSLLGKSGWRADVDQAVTMVRAFDPTLFGMALLFKHTLITVGALLPDVSAVDETSELMEIAERFGDNLTLARAQYVRGIALTTFFGPGRDDAYALLVSAREAARQERFTMVAGELVNLYFATELARAGDLDGAIEGSRTVVETEYDCGDMLLRGVSVSVLVGGLLGRGRPADLEEAQAAIERLAAVPTEPGFVVNELWLLPMRAREAQARGDESAYRDYRDRYRARANALGFEGHIAWAQAME